MRLRALYHIARADYLERVRRHGFLVMLACTVYFAYITIPPNHSRYATMQIHGWRGVYDSAWLGCLVAVMSSIFLSMIGFYLVKNAIERDRVTGVGQILAATPLAKWTYTLGKWLSNLAVLGTMVATVAVAAIGMQLLRGEERHIDLVALFTPFLVVTLPAMAITAAWAVLFESLPGLRGGLGNVVYFFLFISVFAGLDVAPERRGGFGSPAGIRTVMPELVDAVSRESGVHPDSIHFSVGFNIKREGTFDLRTFRWGGMRWSFEQVWPRFAWVGIGAAIAMVASVPFDRFDTVRAGAGAKRKRRRGRGDPADDEEADGAEPSAAAAARPRAVAVGGAAPLVIARPRFNAIALLAAELRLALSSMPKVWGVLALALAVTCVFVPLPLARSGFLPFAWIWPLLLWSQLGSREARHGTERLVFNAPHPLSRHLPLVWFAGFVITAVMGAGVGVRLALAGDTTGVLAWASGACFIPSLALACGVWTGSGKLFEVLYLLLWYCGPMSRVPVLDFIGVNPELAAAGAWRWFGLAAIVLLALAFLGRRIRLRR